DEHHHHEIVVFEFWIGAVTVKYSRRIDRLPAAATIKLPQRMPAEEHGQISFALADVIAGGVDNALRVAGFSKGRIGENCAQAEHVIRLSSMLNITPVGRTMADQQLAVGDHEMNRVIVARCKVPPSAAGHIQKRPLNSRV